LEGFASRKRRTVLRAQKRGDGIPSFTPGKKREKSSPTLTTCGRDAIRRLARRKNFQEERGGPSPFYAEWGGKTTTRSTIKQEDGLERGLGTQKKKSERKKKRVAVIVIVREKGTAHQLSVRQEKKSASSALRHPRNIDRRLAHCGRETSSAEKTSTFPSEGGFGRRRQAETCPCTVGIEGKTSYGIPSAEGLPG